MADLNIVEDVVEEGLELLPTPHRGKVSIARFVTPPLEIVQEGMGVLLGLLEAFLFEKSTGPYLRTWGKIVNVTNDDGLSDDEYRRAIEARQLARQSSGTTAEVLHLLEVMTGAMKTGVVHYGRKSVLLLFMVGADARPFSPRTLTREIRTALPAGTKLLGLHKIQYDNTFGWVEDPNSVGWEQGAWIENVMEDVEE